VEHLNAVACVYHTAGLTVAPAPLTNVVPCTLTDHRLPVGCAVRTLVSRAILYHVFGSHVSVCRTVTLPTVPKTGYGISILSE